MPQAVKPQPRNTTSSRVEPSKPQADKSPCRLKEIPLKQRIPDSFFEAADLNRFPGIK
jgi:hypothetical protein